MGLRALHSRKSNGSQSHLWDGMSGSTAVNEPTSEAASGRKSRRTAFWWILVTCVVIVAVVAPFAYLQYGPLPIEVQTSSAVVIDYDNTTGAWSINRTSYSLDVSICPTFHGWTGGTYTCEFTVANPMNITQYEMAVGFGYGWTVPGNNPTLTTWGSNVTNEPNGTIALMPFGGTLYVNVSARLPDSGGGDFTNYVIVAMVGWGCYRVPCVQG